VGEIFKNLNVTRAWFLDFGTGTAGTLPFGTYAPRVLPTINNFALVNALILVSDLTSSINNPSIVNFTSAGIASYL